MGMKSLGNESSPFGHSSVRRGMAGATRFTIPPDPFQGLAAVFPSGIRAGSTLTLSGALGSGVSRFCYELLAWWSISWGFCVLVDLTRKASPAAIVAAGVDLARLVVLRPAAHRTDRIASAIGALIDGFPLTVVLAPPGAIQDWVIRKARARAASRGVVVCFATPGERREPTLAPLSIILSCEEWFSDSLGILSQRRIKASVREYGSSRVAFITERAGCPHLYVASQRSEGLLSISASENASFQERFIWRPDDPKGYLEVAVNGS